MSKSKVSMQFYKRQVKTVKGLKSLINRLSPKMELFCYSGEDSDQTNGMTVAINVKSLEELKKLIQNLADSTPIAGIDTNREMTNGLILSTNILRKDAVTELAPEFAKTSALADFIAFKDNNYKFVDGGLEEAMPKCPQFALIQEPWI